MTYWDDRAQTLEGARRAAWDDDDWDDGYWHCQDMLADLIGEPEVHLDLPTIEIGCGPGRLLHGSFAIGVDSSPNMVRHALAVGYPAVLNDGYHLPFPDDSVGVAYSVLVFQHVPDDVVASYLREAWRVLVPGGVFVAQFVTHGDDGPHNYPRPTRRMADMVAAAANWQYQEGRTDTRHPEWAWLRAVK